jgi:hypothetical protein
MASPASTWPPSAGPTTIVVPAADAICTAHYSLTIAAPAELVFATIRDTARYSEWNTFVPRVTIDSHPIGIPTDSKVLESGTQFTFHVVMDLKKPTRINDTKLAVTDISTPKKTTEYVSMELREGDGTFTPDLSMVYRIAWREGSGWMSKGLKVERFHEIIVRGENECELRTWENQTSLLSHVVKFMFGETIKARFKDWCEGLKKYSEDQVKISKIAEPTKTNSELPADGSVEMPALSNVEQPAEIKAEEPAKPEKAGDAI